MEGFDPDQTRYGQAYFVETIRAGQPRPYASSEYEYKLTITGKNIANPYNPKLAAPPVLIVGRNPPIERVRDLVRVLCHSFYERKDMPDPFAPELKFLNKIEDTPTHVTWHVLIREEYTD